MGLRQTEPEIKTIGGMEFYITPFPAFKAVNISGSLVSVLAPVIGTLAPLAGKRNKNNLEELADTEVSDKDLTHALEAMASCPALDGDKTEALVRKLLIGGHIVVKTEDEDGNTSPEKLTMDLANEIFCGNIQDMLVLCFYVIQLNFKGFFKKLASQSGGEEQEKTKEPRKIF